MSDEALKIKLNGLFPELRFEEGTQWTTCNVDTGQWPAMALQLKSGDSLAFDYLFCLTCVDWKTHLTMVYHLESTQHRHILVVKSKLDRGTPRIGTVSGIWRTAEFHEREVYELFGVEFSGHPDLRLLILPDGWEGKYPLRKDFEDPVNMIKL
jgi:NADH:ubiquinone oxidoreductase subunit C